MKYLACFTIGDPDNEGETLDFEVEVEADSQQEAFDNVVQAFSASLYISERSTD